MTSQEKTQAVSHISNAAACHMRSIIKLLDVAETTCTDNDGYMADLRLQVDRARKLSYTLLGEMGKLALDAEDREV